MVLISDTKLSPQCRNRRYSIAIFQINQSEIKIQSGSLGLGMLMFPRNMVLTAVFNQI